MKCLCIINPISGQAKGSKLHEMLLPKFEKAGMVFETCISKCKGQIEQMGEHSEFLRYDAVLIIGGDGSVNEFVNGMMKRKDGMRLPIGIIPAGTGNSLLHDLQLLDPIKAAEQIVKFESRRIDLMKLECSTGIFYAFNVIGWGLPSTINQKSENWKQFGGQRYNLASIQEIVRNPNWPVEIKLASSDGTMVENIKGNYSFFMACNTIHTGKGMKVAPLAKMDDGLVDIVLLKTASRIQLIQLFSKIFKGEHAGSPLVEFYQVNRFSLEEKNPSVLIIDGQIAGTTPFSVQVLPRELQILN